MKLSLRAKIFLIILFSLLAISAINLYIVTSVFSDKYSQAISGKTIAVGKALSFQLDRLLKLGILLDQIVGFDEQAKEVVENYPEIEQAMVLDAQGKVLFSSEPQHQESLLSEELSQIQKLEREETIFIPEKKAYFSVVPFFDENGNRIATVLLKVPQDIVSNQVRSVALITVAISAATFLLLALILFGGLNVWVSKPIKKLTDFIADVKTSGNLEKKAEVKSGDEIGELATAFNEMTSKLRDYQQGLEQKVAERTRELEEAKAAQAKQLEETERINNVMVGRELKMIELKKEIEELKKTSWFWLTLTPPILAFSFSELFVHASCCNFGGACALLRKA